MIRVICMICIIQCVNVIALPIPIWGEIQSNPEKDKEIRRVWGKPVGGQAISITTEKVVYAPEEAIILEINFKNIGHEDVRVIEESPLEMYKLIVLLPNGKEAPFTLYGKNANENWRDGSKAIFVLKPGMQRRVTFMLSRLFDFSLAGKYSVSVKRDVFKYEKVESISEAISNKLEITVDDRLEHRANTPSLITE
jgi:hypothetical protein